MRKKLCIACVVGLILLGGALFISGTCSLGDSNADLHTADVYRLSLEGTVTSLNADTRDAVLTVSREDSRTVNGYSASVHIREPRGSHDVFSQLTEGSILKLSYFPSDRQDDYLNVAEDDCRLIADESPAE